MGLGTSPQSESVLNLYYDTLNFGLPEIVPIQNIWGTMAHRDRDLGHSRSFPTGALITRSGLAAPGALDPNIPR